MTDGDEVAQTAEVVAAKRAEFEQQMITQDIEKLYARFDGAGPLTRAEAWFAECFLEQPPDLHEVRRQHRLVGTPGLVVGMAPGPRTSASLPMFPHPAGSAGGRLMRMSEMPVEAYLGRLRRANLCRGAFRVAEARDRARELYLEHRAADGPRTRFVLCGKPVTDAFLEVFKEDRRPAWFERRSWAGVEYVAVPHPSGRCREYNAEEVRARAGAAVRWAARWEEST